MFDPVREIARMFALFALFFGCFQAQLSYAWAENWVVKRVSGIAYFVAPGVEAYRVRQGMIFEKGLTIGTRAGSRVLIARGSDTIAVGPNTTFAMSKFHSNGINTKLLQRKGAIEVEVHKRKRPHFSVETPFFAAVVKGTQFKVEVREGRAQVNVRRGMVGVSDFASGNTVDLGSGQSASSEPSRKIGLTVAGTSTPKVKSGQKRVPSFQTQPMNSLPTSNVELNSSSGNSGGFLSNLFAGGIRNPDLGARESRNPANNDTRQNGGNANAGVANQSSGSSGGSSDDGDAEGDGGGGGGSDDDDDDDSDDDDGDDDDGDDDDDD
jgi:hypothetical protein